MITPAYGTVALPHEYVMAVRTARERTHTALYNVLDYAGGVVPWTTVSTSDVRVCAAATHPDKLDYLEYETCALDTAVVLPVGVQVATPPYREEMCLCVMQLLADAQTRHATQINPE
jgi:fatty acid amide hydrolase/fatty acid amide hydrolase 2